MSEANVEFDEQQAERRLRDYVASQYELRKKAKGTVTGKDVCDILESLGLPFEESEVKPLLPDWGAVTPEAASEAVTTVRITHNAELEHMMERLEENTIRLSLCEYISYLLPWTTKDPSWEFRTIEFKLDLAPRQVLFISTGVVLFVSGVAILLLMSLLWLNQANSRDETQMDDFVRLVQSFAEAFDQRYLEVHSNTMIDEADSLAKLVERQHTLNLQDRLSDLSSAAALLAGVVNAVGGAAVSAAIEPQVATLWALRDIFIPTVGPLADVTSTVSNLNAAATDSWETIVVSRPQNAPSTTTSTVEVQSAMLNCPYGLCNYDALDCVSQGFASAAASTVVTLTSTKGLTWAAAAAVFTRFDVNTTSGMRSIVLCSMIPSSVLDATRQAQMIDVVASINTELREPIATRREVLLAQWSGSSSSQVTWLTPMFRVVDLCYTVYQTCTGLDVLAQQVSVNQLPTSSVVSGYSGEQLISAAAPTNVSGLIIVIDQSWSGFLEAERQDLVTVFNRINQKTTSKAEVSIGRYDAVTGVIVPQVTDFRYSTACFTSCNRFDAASQAATLALTSQAAGALIAPNYQPVATVAAYSFIGQGLNLAVVVERGVESIRGDALSALVNIFNAANQQYSGSLEVELVHYQGVPTSKTYDPFAQCNQIRECLTDATLGALYRSDCVHCSRQNTASYNAGVIQSLTTLKYPPTCASGTNCSVDTNLWRKAVTDTSGNITTTTTGDYRGVSVLTGYVFITNFSVGAIVKIDASENSSPILERIGIASAVAFVIVVGGLILLIFFSRQVLDRIELEWLTYKDQIDAEKTKFDAMVQDVLPAQVSEDLRKSQKMAMSLPNMSFVFLDVVGMSDRTKNWSPELVCRYVTYIFTVVDTVCNHYSLNKVRVFGDTYFAVGGLGESATEEHCVFRAACFGSVVVQLLGQRFAHFPDRVPLIKETFEDYVAKNGPVFPDVSENPTDVGHIMLPPMRLGMHFGIGTFCIIETGRTPAYEVFGPGVALAARMQSTSLGNRIHMSGAMKEMLERLDKDRLFDFDPMRKTVVKGQGTITSFFVRSASVVVPLSILQTLGIEHSNRRVYYDDSTGAPPAGAAAAPVPGP